jgi:2-polyprenyl-3-methyl-5-hydroxy-6-metoxy-1,4-benzoquinol methylase
MSEIDVLLAEQIRYYRDRAGEYEDWWLRRGRYDHGAEANARWFAEAAEVTADLERFRPGGHVLELACGTGLWTAALAASAASVTAVDASAEVLQIARAKVAAANVQYIEADLFAWEPERSYDVCFFSFWLSHVPRERWRPFWEKVRRALSPGGRVYLIDSARSERASARDHALQEPEEELMLRRLADGREYRIVKHWFDADGLGRQLAELGWDARIQSTREFFIYGYAMPPGPGQ